MSLIRKVKNLIPKRPIVHTETKNITFLQTAADLKKLGIKNCTFFLNLYDKKLEFIDPHSPFLTEELQIAIINECLINPWYFLRECVRIPDQGGTGIPYQLNRGNLAATFCLMNGIDHYLVLPRQIGKTISTIAALLWIFLFGTTNSEMMFLNKEQKDADANLDRLKRQRELLPLFLQMRFAFDETGKQVKESNNVTTLSNKTNGNKIVTKPKATSKERAEGIGRGATQPVQYADEVEFTNHIKTILEAAGPAFRTARENARRNNAPYCRVFTSTPGDLDTACGKEAMEIVNDTAKWSEKMYDWKIDDIREYVDKSCETKILYIEYSYKQLGKDQKWFKEACDTVFNNPIKIKREILLQRMRGSSESPFEMEALEAIKELAKKPIQEEFINKFFKLDIYELLDRNKIYLIGVDVSAARGRDNSAVTVVDPKTLKPVAEFKSSLIGITDLTKFLHVLVKKYIPRSILCIERNYGEAIIDALKNSDIRNNVYFDKNKDFVTVDDRLDPQGFLLQEAHNRKFFGVWVSKSSRQSMIDILFSFVEERKDKFVTENITNDLFTLIRTKNGKIEHAPSFHDDSLFSFLYALYVYYYGNNLARFGLVKGMIPDDDNQNKGMDYEDMLAAMPQETREFFAESRPKSMEDLQNNFAREIERARQEMSLVGGYGGSSNIMLEDLDSDDYGEISMDFFNEMNDLDI